MCEVTGHAHPDYLLPFLSAEQLLDWSRYEKQYGFRDDIHWGLLCCLIANQWIKKGDPPHRPEEFMPYYSPEPIDAATLRDRLRGIHKRK